MSAPSRRHAVRAGALVALLLLTGATPVLAWRPATSAIRPVADHRAAPAASATDPDPGAAGIGSPVDSREEALSAGGRQAPEGRRHTVVRYGIDVSHWQGRIDWPRVARSGVRFAIAKATEGTWMVDPWYRRNRERAMREGIAFTAYHFANPSRERGDAKREADWFLKNARLKGANLLPALDLETSGGLRDAELKRWVFQWVRRVERKLGVKPMIYTSPGFWGGWVGDTPAVARAGYQTLWVSHWYVRKPLVPARRWAGEGWTFWQWTETGRVAGVQGYVDRNVYSGPRLKHLTLRALRDGRPPRDGVRDERDQRDRRPRPR